MSIDDDVSDDDDQRQQLLMSSSPQHKTTTTPHKLLTLTFALFVACIALYALSAVSTNTTRWRHHRHHYDQSVANFAAIERRWRQLPVTCPASTDIDVFDALPLSYVNNATAAYSCPRRDPMTSVDDSGRVRVERRALPANASCFYTRMWRRPLFDNYIDYDTWRPLASDTIVQLTLDDQMVNVSCWLNATRIYRNTHLFVPDFKPKTKAVNVTSSFKPNVLLVFVESLSRLSFERFMRETREALRRLHAKPAHRLHVFRNFVKPMDNSFPNAVALLTGMRVDPTQEALLKANGTHFDRLLPYVWRDFADAGYVTGLLEDMAQIGVFNYGKKGFAHAPVDWYPRAYWVQMYPENGDFRLWYIMNEQKHFCFDHNGAKLDLFNEQVVAFVRKQQSQHNPFFLYAFHSQVTHENFNSFASVDASFASLLRRLEPYLNDTIVVFAGDHGSRVGGFTRTSMGRFEERTPFVSLSIPPKLARRHPQLRMYLDANSDRLVTWYDFHQLLLDVAHQRYEPRGWSAASGPISVWRQLSAPSRTCADANIDAFFCVCGANVSLDTGVGAGWWAGVALVDHLNTLLPPQHKQAYNGTLEAHYVLNYRQVGHWMYERVYAKVRVMPADVTLAGFLIRDRLKDYRNWFVERDAIHAHRNLDYDASLRRTVCARVNCL